ncbi:MAG: EF-hand domain-containing protein [bacterium]|nr:EF-hand domain-containing protein [bacterium]
MISSISGNSSMLSLSSTSTRPAPPDPKEMFNSIDTDGDGKVTLAEMQAMSESMPSRGDGDQPAAEDMFAELDGDSDGAVSFEEFEARRPSGPPQGPPPQMMAAGGSGGFDLAALFGERDEEATGSLLAMMA